MIPGITCASPSLCTWQLRQRQAGGAHCTHGMARCTITSCAVVLLWVLTYAAAAASAAALPRASTVHTLHARRHRQHLSGPASDQVRWLPGVQGPPTAKQYSGYVTVDASRGRRLHYYLATTPGVSHCPVLLLWLTGGPGCSSMDAFAYEHGPYSFGWRSGASRPLSVHDVVLSPNPHAWSSIACMLYVDSPAGVGYSYDANGQHGPSHHYVSDDTRVIDDLVEFLRGFAALYPDVMRSDLYIAGESYGGVYVPLLVERLLQVDAASSTGSSVGAKTPPLFHLKGYIIGNPVTDDTYDAQGAIDFAYGHGLVSPEACLVALAECKATHWNISDGSRCAASLDALQEGAGRVNPYDINAPCLHHHDAGPRQQQQQQQQQQQEQHWRVATRRSTVQLGRARRRGIEGNGGAAITSAARAEDSRLVGHTISCADRSAALLYFNDPGVRQALHAAPEADAGRWEPCSDVLDYNHTAGSMLPVHKRLLSGRGAAAMQNGQLRALAYSGSADWVVPFTGTRAWTYALGGTPTRPWHPWTMHGDDQVAGYAIEFANGLTFATVSGAGHMVPQSHPAQALALLQRWLAHDL